MTDQPKLDPSPRPGVMHDFGCTHDPCRCRPQRLSDLIIEHGPYAWDERQQEPRPDISGQLCDADALNQLREELIAARRLTELLKRFRVEVAAWRDGEGVELVLTDQRCTPGDWERRWSIDNTGGPGDEEPDLAELVQRAAEHAEVCG